VLFVHNFFMLEFSAINFVINDLCKVGGNVFMSIVLSVFLSRITEKVVKEFFGEIFESLKKNYYWERSPYRNFSSGLPLWTLQHDIVLLTFTRWCNPTFPELYNNNIKTNTWDNVYGAVVMTKSC